MVLKTDDLYELKNDKRRNILLTLDTGSNVSDLELGMYDLTSYYKDRLDDDNSLAEKILYLQNDERKIQHINKLELFLMPEQLKALNSISKHDRLILSAPTSFGKTMILKEYIYLNKPQIVVFIVPTNALAYELEQDFKQNLAFNDYKIFDKNKTYDEFLKTEEEKLLFIGTQEKYLEIKDSIAHINLFIIDEAYKLEQKVSNQRSYKLSQAFLDSQMEKCDKVCLLSPNAKFEGFEKYNFEIFTTRFNAVDKLFHTVNECDFYNQLIEKAAKEKTILFCLSPKDLIDVEQVLNINTIEKNKFITLLENEFHPEWTVIKLLKKGVLCHDGLMPKFVQNKMINLFNNNNNYKLLIGTNSISEGINTPTKNIFINPNCSVSGRELLIKNTIGRAGRLRQYPIGHIYSTNKELLKIEQEDIIIKLAIDDDDNLKELLESKDDQKIKELAYEYALTMDFCNYIIKKYKISINRFKKILDVLKKDYPYANITNLPFMGQMVFSSDYYNAEYDKFYITGVLNKYYKSGNANVSLNGFNNKVNYVKEKLNNLSLSQIIDGYMRFIYSTLDYIICPIANIGKEIIEKDSDWVFGKNVSETINNFNQKYYRAFFGVEDFNIFTENQRNILLTLREYGVNVKDCNLSQDILEEIEQNLAVRYSTYDVMNAIKKLSRVSENNKETYNKIIDKYFI